MAKEINLDPQKAKLLDHHLDEWTKWRQQVDPDTADTDWDTFILKSQQKAKAEQLQMDRQIAEWQQLHDLQTELKSRIAGDAHGGQTMQ